MLTSMKMDDRQQSLAVVGGRRLGDNLIEMVLAENARRAGYRTVVFSTILLELADWFPGRRISPSLDLDDAGNLDELAGFSRILYPKPPREQVRDRVAGRWLAYGQVFAAHDTRVRAMVRVCREMLRLEQVTAENGIRPPSSLQWRKHGRRVCLHPTSAEESKNWPAARFSILAARLEQAGFEPVFIMSAAELEGWRPLLGDRFPVRGFASIADCAAFLYESGFFIGNDSGGGHLASCLHIPVLSIHGRRGKARQWRPGWGCVEVVTPTFNLIGSSLRQRCWKYFLTVRKVEQAFYRLTKQATGLDSPFLHGSA